MFGQAYARKLRKSRAGSNGVWHLDAKATEVERANLRNERLAGSQPAEEWWAAERERVVAKEFVPEVLEMYEQSLSFAKFDREFRGFWQVEDDFLFEAVGEA